MKKICVMGNSHVACIKKAWDNSSSEGVDIDFLLIKHKECKH